MASYYINEAVFDLSERVFVDETVHALEQTLPSGETLAVFVHRRAAGGKALRQLVDEHLALNDARLSRYAVVDQAEAVVGGLPAIVVRTRWRQDRETLYQAQAQILVEDQRMIFAVTTPLAAQAACDETLDAILRTVTWRKD
jgi:hypothetical protein